MRILYISHYFPPEFGAGAARAHGMTRWLTRFGHDVTIVTPYPNYLTNASSHVHERRKQKKENIDGVDVHRTWVYSPPQQNNWRRIINYASFTASSWLYGRKLPGPFDVVIASSPPLFLGIAGVALSRRFQAPLVFDVRDMWPEIAVILGVFRHGSLMERSWSQLATFIYSRASAIIPVTLGMKQDMLARGLPPEKLHLIFNGVDLELIQPDAPDLRESLNLKDKFVVLFAGLIGVMQGVEALVDAAALLKNHPEIAFLIVGDGARKELVAKKIESLCLQNIQLLPAQPPQKIPRFLNTADICLAPLANEKVTGVIPYKMLEAWAYQRPVITTDYSEAGDLVKQCQGGITASFSDPQAIADAILSLAAKRDEIKHLGLGGRKCVERLFNRRTQARKMEEILQMVITTQR